MSTPGTPVPALVAALATAAVVAVIVEALVFASPEPLTPKMLFKLLADEPKDDVQAALDALVAGGRWHFALPGTPRGEV